jgi:hypothetical protein
MVPGRDAAFSEFVGRMKTHIYDPRNQGLALLLCCVAELKRTSTFIEHKEIHEISTTHCTL